MEWISCKQRMPEPDVKVLICIQYGAGSQEISMSFTTKRFPDIFDHFLGDRITHWQYLPEPPKYDWKLCDQKVNGSCPHHNLHCGFPKCEQVPIPSKHLDNGDKNG